MKYIAWILLLVQLAMDICILLGLVFCDDKLVEKSSSKCLSIPLKDRINIHIFISLFNESRNIEDTIRYFSKFLSDNTRLVLITTEKERRVFGENKTLEKIAEILENPMYSSLPITVVNYPLLRGNKGAQLNYAIAQLEGILPEDYIIVYDSDSRPDVKSIEELKNIIRANKPNVIQQSSVYLGNYDRSSAYMKVEALFESIRALGIERRNYLLRRSTKGRLRPYCYCVGHGMCFKVSFLQDIDFFPEPNEDVPIGVKIALLDEIIEPMVTKDSGNVTRNMKMLFFQSGNWVKAPFVCLKTLFQFHKRSTIGFWNECGLFLSIVIDFLSWISPMALALLAILSICSSAHDPFFFIAWLLLKMALPELQILVFRKKYIAVPISYKEILLAPLRDLFRGLSIISLILNTIGISYNEMGRDDD